MAEKWEFSAVWSRVTEFIGLLRELIGGATPLYCHYPPNFMEGFL